MEVSGEPAAASVVVPCADLHTAVAFYTDDLGFRLDSIFPADAPSVANLSGFGLRVRLERSADDAGGAGGDGTWVQGRAGMRYRDLVPDRLGGRLIASHIQIGAAGPVPDYVHFHEIRFQMIYCLEGWVRVVYEDQGPPFVMHAGDCVLQPPRIRHRVLEAAAGTEVIELGSPARHETFVDHELALPTPTERRERLYGGQRFVRHEAASAPWAPRGRAGFEARDTRIGAATGGLAEVHVVRPRGGQEAGAAWRHDGALLFYFVLAGTAELRGEGRGRERLVEGDARVVPAGVEHAWAECSAELEMLEVAIPSFSSA